MAAMRVLLKQSHSGDPAKSPITALSKVKVGNVAKISMTNGERS